MMNKKPAIAALPILAALTSPAHAECREDIDTEPWANAVVRLVRQDAATASQRTCAGTWVEANGNAAIYTAAHCVPEDAQIGDTLDILVEWPTQARIQSGNETSLMTVYRTRGPMLLSRICEGEGCIDIDQAILGFPGVELPTEPVAITDQASITMQQAGHQMDHSWNHSRVMNEQTHTSPFSRFMQLEFNCDAAVGLSGGGIFNRAGELYAVTHHKSKSESRFRDIYAGLAAQYEAIQWGEFEAVPKPDVVACFITTDDKKTIRTASCRTAK